MGLSYAVSASCLIGARNGILYVEMLLQPSSQLWRSESGKSQNGWVLWICFHKSLSLVLQKYLWSQHSLVHKVVENDCYEYVTCTCLAVELLSTQAAVVCILTLVSRQTAIARLTLFIEFSEFLKMFVILCAGVYFALPACEWWGCSRWSYFPIFSAHYMAGILCYLGYPSLHPTVIGFSFFYRFTCITVGSASWVLSLVRTMAGQLFLQYFDAVGWVFSPVKLSPG